MGIEVRNSTSVAGNGANPSFSFSVSGSGMNTGFDRYLLVSVSSRSANPTACTFGGVAMTLLHSQTGMFAREHVYGLVNPPQGSSTVAVTMVAGEYVIGVVSFNGVHQTAPIGTAVSGNGNNTAPTINVTSATGELVADNVCVRGDTGQSLTVGASQTQYWNRASDGSGQGTGTCWGGGSTEPGAATTTMSWTAAISQRWAIGAVPLKPASPRMLRLIGDIE
jgi:hypothetical protein